MREPIDYWKECLSQASDDCGLHLTDEQLVTLAKAVKGGYECYDMAFYSPPASDRINEIEREWKQKLDSLNRNFDAYKVNAEKAVKQALNRHPDDVVSITDYGEVFLHGGRTTQIQ